jgi:acetylornithine/succinyldiaminopimelate/putrescine aminotransferase
MILVFGSYLDPSSLAVTNWLRHFSKDVSLIANMDEHKSFSLNQLEKDSIESIWYRKYETYQLNKYSLNNTTTLASLHGDIIRFAPPLVMTEKQLMECVEIIRKTVGGF